MSRDWDRDLDKMKSSALESRDHGLEITSLAWPLPPFRTDATPPPCVLPYVLVFSYWVASRDVPDIRFPLAIFSYSVPAKLIYQIFTSHSQFNSTLQYLLSIFAHCCASNLRYNNEWMSANEIHWWRLASASLRWWSRNFVAAKRRSDGTREMKYCLLWLMCVMSITRWCGCVSVNRLPHTISAL